MGGYTLDKAFLERSADEEARSLRSLQRAGGSQEMHDRHPTSIHRRFKYVRTPIDLKIITVCAINLFEVVCEVARLRTWDGIEPSVAQVNPPYHE